MNKVNPPTYEGEALRVLAYEFPSSKKSEAEIKIRELLTEHNLGDFDQARIEVLRQIKNELQEEISKGRKSSFYTHSHGQFAELRDFNTVKLAAYIAERYQNVPKIAIENFVNYAVYVYYLR